MSFAGLVASPCAGALWAQEAGAAPIAVPVAARDRGSLALAYVRTDPAAVGLRSTPAASSAGLREEDGEEASVSLPKVGGKASLPAPHSRAAGQPWVGTVEWSVPESYGADVFEGMQTTFQPWAYFGDELERARVSSVPPDLGGVRQLPLFAVFAPQESDFSRKLKRLARAKLYREVRHRLRREWKSVFLDHPSLTYADYESRLFQINNIGKDLADRDDFSAIASATEVKQSFLGRRHHDGESDIPLVAWGPFTVKDSGALKFDLGRAAMTDADNESLEVGDEKRVPVVATRDYEIETAFNFDVDPFQGAMAGDARASVRRVGLSVEVSWLSAVLGRELVSTEMDLETDLYGDFKGFFNIVIKSR